MKSAWIANLSLHAKIRAIVLIVSGAALLGGFAALLAFQTLSSWTTIASRYETMAAVIGDQTSAALEFGQPEAAELVLASLRAETHVMAAAVYDARGTLFARYLRPGEQDTLKTPPAEPGRQRSERGELLVFQPIQSGGERIGTFYLRSDMEQVRQWVRINVVIMGLILLAVGALIPLLSGWLGRSVSAPVAELASVVQAVSAERDYSVRAQKRGDDEVGRLIDGFNDMLSQIQARDSAIARAQEVLEQRVQERTAELEASNKELETFSYSVSHDLRAPLRAMDGFSQVLLETRAAELDDEAKHYLQRIRLASQRMAELIDGLLDLARISRSSFERDRVDLAVLAAEIVRELRARDPEREVELAIAPTLPAHADPRLVRAALSNLLENAWKYTRRRAHARIELGASQQGGETVYFVRDDGAGFDMAYTRKLFGVFPRLHSEREFEGTGIGLATVQRIVQRHGGRIWAEAAVDKGATFFFTLGPAEKRSLSA